MLLLIDGGDGVGKSTLVGEITELLHKMYPNDTVELWKKGPPSQHPLDEYVTPLLSYHPGRGHHIICDRWHLGELVYPKIFGRESHLDSELLLRIETFLKARGAYLALIDRDYTDVINTIETRGDDLVSPDQATPILLEFNHAFQQSTLTKSISYIEQLDLAEWLIAEASRAELKAKTLDSEDTRA